MNKPLQVGQHVSTAPAMSRTPPDENSMTVKALQYHMNKGSPCRKSLHRSLGHSIASSKMYQYKAKLGSAGLLFNLADFGGVGSCAKPLVLGWTSYAAINMGTGSGARLETKAFLW